MSAHTVPGRLRRTPDRARQNKARHPRPSQRSILLREAGLHALPEGSGLYALVGAGGIAGILTAGPRCDGRPYSEANVSLLTAFANQVASFLERERYMASPTQAGVARQADQLKSSLLSSVFARAENAACRPDGHGQQSA